MICQDRRPAPCGASYSDAVAQREGWRLIASHPHPDGSEHVEIQKAGPDSRFREDEDARCFVVHQARQGSGFHRDALDRLDQIERNLVRLFCGDWQ